MRNMLVARAEGEECMMMARLDVGALRMYRVNESGSIVHRRPETYRGLVGE